VGVGHGRIDAEPGAGVGDAAKGQDVPCR
jgi:hypothetical protein